MLCVPVTTDVALDAGRWQTVPAPDGRLWRIIEPPARPLYLQVIDYLDARMPAEPVGLRLQEEARALMAVCLRWGSYLAVLMDHSKPRAPQAGRAEISQIADSEMRRINIEASAALAWWLDCLRTEPDRYHRLIAAAAARLPMSKQRSPMQPDFQARLLMLAEPDLAAPIVADLPADRLERVRTMAARSPTRLLANTLINACWRNNAIEALHGGEAGDYPLLAYRITRQEAHQLARATVDRLVSALLAVRELMYERSERAWAERVLPFALVPFYAPSGWALDQESCRVELRGGEPTVQTRERAVTRGKRGQG